MPLAQPGGRPLMAGHSATLKATLSRADQYTEWCKNEKCENSGLGPVYTALQTHVISAT